MNKNIFLAVLLVFTGTMLVSCDTQTKEGGDETASTTENVEATAQEVAAGEETTEFDKQQEAFHTYMAGTFHPAEEDDLAPLREQHADMVAAAETWAATDIPAKYADKNLDQQLDQLVSGAKDISLMVEKGAEDAELKQAIFDLHDVFHGIMGACKDAEEHGKHKKHHRDRKGHQKHHKDEH